MNPNQWTQAQSIASMRSPGVSISETILAIAAIGFAIFLVGGILIRIVRALIHRKSKSLKNDVFRPIVDSAAKQSEFLGWPVSTFDNVTIAQDETTSTQTKRSDAECTTDDATTIEDDDNK